MDWILARLREPSTYAGLSVLAGVIGVSQDQWTAIGAVIAAIAGALAVFLPEHKSA